MALKKNTFFIINCMTIDNSHKKAKEGEEDVMYICIKWWQSQLNERHLRIKSQRHNQIISDLIRAP